jgi:hypothetical protein
VALVQQRQLDFEAINTDRLFDIDHFLGLDLAAPHTREDAVRFFLLRSAALGAAR